jgi:hypothetical protein
MGFSVQRIPRFPALWYFMTQPIFSNWIGTQLGFRVLFHGPILCDDPNVVHHDGGHVSVF